ncbi:hypothetical protein CHUAL_005361 [Chamberlinius hualienensis]
MESTNHSFSGSKVGGGFVGGGSVSSSGGGVNNSGGGCESESAVRVTQTTPKKSMLLNFRPSSFVSSRAQALRQKFANSKRSLSDSCKEITSTMSTSFGSETPTNPNNMSVEFPQQPIQPPQSRFQQRRGAVVPVPVLPEYDPDPYSPLGSPSHDEVCIDADLLGLSSPTPTPQPSEKDPTNIRSSMIEKLEDIARPSMIEKFEDISKQKNDHSFLWQYNDDATLNHKRIFSSSPSMADNKFSLAEALISDDRRRPRPPGRLPLTSSGSTGQLSLKLNTSNWPSTLPTHYSTNFDNDQQENTQKDQIYDGSMLKSVERSTSPKDPWSTSDDELPNVQSIPTLSCTPPAILQQLQMQSPSPSVHSNHPAAGSSSKHGGCCMPIPSHPTPTPSPPSPSTPFPGSYITSPQSGKSRKSYTSSTRSGSSASGHHHHVHHGHHGSYSRSESVASISVGSGGCLSGLYNPLDWKSRSGNPKLIHQMSMDETLANAVAAAKLGSPSSSPDFAYRDII